MPVGYIFLLGSLIGFGLLGIFHKVGDHPNCRPRVLAFVLLFWGAILTTVYTSLFIPNSLKFPPKVLMIGAAGGLFSSLALFVFQTGLRFGKISTSWLVLNLSMSVPILISLVFFNEKLNWIKIIGVLLVLSAIVMLWRDKKFDLDKSAADTGGFTSGRHFTWLLLMVLAFVFNGLAATSQKVLVEAGQGDYTWQFYIILYSIGFVLMATLTAVGKHLPNRRELLTGFIMALCSIAGNVLLTLALGHGVAGAVAFPVGNGGCLTLVVLAGVLFFKEKVHPIGRAGIACGICAILLLVMEPTLLQYLKQVASR
jgi:drug/metabolite transporter (DMT)-like permease